MHKHIWRSICLAVVGGAVIFLGCRDQGTTPALEAAVVNPHQAIAESHNAICEAVLERVEQQAASITTMQDLDAVFAASFNEAFKASGLKGDYATVLQAGAEILAFNMGFQIDRNDLAKTDETQAWLDAGLRAGYTSREIDLFYQVCGKLSRRLSSDAYSDEVAKAERELRQHPSASSDAMMRVFAVARASYRFWHEQGAFHLRALRNAVHQQYGTAKVDTADEVVTDNATFSDVKAMAMAAVGGTTAVVSLEVTAVASATQFIYDNRHGLWEMLSNDQFWWMWLHGFYSYY